MVGHTICVSVVSCFFYAMSLAFTCHLLVQLPLSPISAGRVDSNLWSFSARLCMLSWHCSLKLCFACACCYDLLACYSPFDLFACPACLHTADHKNASTQGKDCFHCGCIVSGVCSLFPAL